MPLRDQDRAVWIGGDEVRGIGSSGKVRFGVEHGHGMVCVDWGGGLEGWYTPNRDVVTCKQAANKGIEPWASCMISMAERKRRRLTNDV